MTQELFEILKRKAEGELLAHAAGGQTYTRILNNLNMLDNVYTHSLESETTRRCMEEDRLRKIQSEERKRRLEELKLKLELLEAEVKRIEAEVARIQAIKKDGVSRTAIFNGLISLVEFAMLFYGQDVKYIPKNLVPVAVKPKLY